MSKAKNSKGVTVTDSLNFKTQTGKVNKGNVSRKNMKFKGKKRRSKTAVKKTLRANEISMKHKTQTNATEEQNCNTNPGTVRQKREGTISYDGYSKMCNETGYGSTFVCHTCGKLSDKVSNMQEHLRVHTGERPFSCDVCGQRFIRKGDRKKHMAVHSAEKPHLCDTCGMAFARSGDMHRHKWIHTREVIHICEICGENYARLTELKHHMAWHRGEIVLKWKRSRTGAVQRKPHSCDTCGMQFHSKPSLQTHLVQHGQTFIDKCGVCNIQFRHKDSLRRHMLSHSGMKEYKCDQCGKEFHKACRLRYHLTTHTDHKPHICQICCRRFTRAYGLRNHVCRLGRRTTRSRRHMTVVHVEDKTETKDPEVSTSYCADKHDNKDKWNSFHPYTNETDDKGTESDVDACSTNKITPQKLIPDDRGTESDVDACNKIIRQKLIADDRGTESDVDACNKITPQKLIADDRGTESDVDACNKITPQKLIPDDRGTESDVDACNKITPQKLIPDDRGTESDVDACNKITPQKLIPDQRMTDNVLTPNGFIDDTVVSGGNDCLTTLSTDAEMETYLDRKVDSLVKDCWTRVMDEVNVATNGKTVTTSMTKHRLSSTEAENCFGGDTDPMTDKCFTIPSHMTDIGNFPEVGNSEEAMVSLTEDSMTTAGSKTVVEKSQNEDGDWLTNVDDNMDDQDLSEDGGNSEANYEPEIPHGTELGNCLKGVSDSVFNDAVAKPSDRDMCGKVDTETNPWLQILTDRKYKPDDIELEDDCFNRGTVGNNEGKVSDVASLIFCPKSVSDKGVIPGYAYDNAALAVNETVVDECMILGCDEDVTNEIMACDGDLAVDNGLETDETFPNSLIKEEIVSEELTLTVTGAPVVNSSVVSLKKEPADWDRFIKKETEPGEILMMVGRESVTNDRLVIVKKEPDDYMDKF